jgi:hypothetical protein
VLILERDARVDMNVDPDDEEEVAGEWGKNAQTLDGTRASTN